MNENTNDLMKKLESTDTSEGLASYLEEIRDKYPSDFKSFMEVILKERNMTIADVQRKSGIDRNYIYQIMDGRKNPGRDKIIAIAIACQMDLAECQRALEITNEGILYPKSRRDSIIIFAINNKLSVMDLNGLLEEYKVPILD